MRYSEILTESTEEPDAFKGWYNSVSQRMVEIEPQSMHWQVLAAQPDQFGISQDEAHRAKQMDETGEDDPSFLNRLAIDQGWVRVANFNDAMWVMTVPPELDFGYIEAASPSGARKAMLWLAQKNLLPNRMQIQVGSTVHDLRDDRLHSFVQRGVLREAKKQTSYRSQ